MPGRLGGVRSPSAALVLACAVVAGLVSACGAGSAGGATAGEGNSASSPAGGGESDGGTITITQTVPARGGAAAGTGTTASTGPAGPRRCSTNVLKGRIDLYDPKGAAGSAQDAALGLTNVGSTTCTIYGYPGMRLIDSNGHERESKVVRDRSRTPRTVSVAPGSTAWSHIAWGTLPSPHEQGLARQCGFSVDEVQVTPPDETTQVDIKRRLGGVCDEGTVYVGPFGAQRPS
jgi:hypothetical protein